MEQRVIMLRGLPSSGKTTWAKQQLEEHPGQYYRVNKDELRAMMTGGKQVKGSEDIILALRDHLIRCALRANKSIIVDDTNLNPVHEQRIRKLVGNFHTDRIEAGSHERVSIEVKFFDVPIDECVERDKYRPNSVGEKVIRDMYTQYLSKPDKVVTIEYDPSLPDTIICDIDGTLAINTGGRNPYDYARVREDTVNSAVSKIITRFRYTSKHAEIILFSGREDSCESQTKQWLLDNGISYDFLAMRKTGDYRKDSVVKKEMYEEFAKGKYNILFVMDDRLQVCRMWYSLGLPLLRVGDPDSDF